MSDRPPRPAARRVLHRRLTPRRAVALVIAFTVTIVVLAALLMWVFVHDEFPTFGLAAWWAVQTVTTVGYGDVVPQDTLGRFLASLVMLSGIGLITVVSGAIASILVASARSERKADVDEPLRAELEAIRRRLDELSPPGRSSDSAP